MSSFETVTEYFDSSGATLAVEEGVIRGVKILGLESKNGRVYPKETVTRAQKLYEGVKVNVDHPTGDPGQQRSYSSRMGVMENVQMGEGESGLFADFRYNPKHALAEQLQWDATNAPENVGFSHNVLAKIIRRGGKAVVEEITRVQSVDLVADPATTRGLFEATDHQEEEGANMPADTLTLEGLKANYPALVETIATQAVEASTESEDQKTVAAELAKLKEELDTYKVKERLAEDRLAVDALIKEAKLPEHVVTDVWVESLMAADEPTREKLIEDRQAIAKHGGNSKPTSKEQCTTESDDSSLAGMTSEQLGNRWKA